MVKGKTQKYNSTRNTRIAKPKPVTSMSIRNKNSIQRGQMEGMGIFGDIGKWLYKAAKKTNKWLKKTNIISKTGPVVGKLVGSVYPQAGKIISDAAKFAGQHGYGTVNIPAGGGKPIKSITATQQKALQAGHGKLLKSGGISLASAKKMYPNIKNISAAQWKGIRQLRARKMKGGGYKFVKGVAVAPQSTHARINVTGRKNVRNVKGKGLKLAGSGKTAGSGLKLAGGYKKKRRMRRKPGPMRM